MRIFLLIAIFIINFNCSIGQNSSWYRSSDNKEYWKNRKPFEGYWQQDVNYKIKADVDDKTDIITAFEELTYFNNSPDTLYKVYFHLYQNAFIKGSYLEKLNLANNFKQKFGKYEIEGKGIEVEELKVNGKDQKLVLDNTILQVTLDKPILPGSSEQFQIKFKTYFDAGGNQRRRMKMYNAYGYKHYNGVHWYPRICVYDRKFGWTTDQHLGKEFYGDFGTYDVELTFPNNFIMDATGELQNSNEVLPVELRKKLDISNFRNKPMEETPSVIIEADGTKKTWKFMANNVHDFAWTADPTYRIGQVDIKLPSGHKVSCIALAQEPHAGRWQDAALVCSKVIEFYSREYGEFVYPKMIVADARDGMEYPMLTLDGGLSPGYYGLFAHEVGHNWFFGMVGNNETYRASLDEGFTQFITHRFMSSISPEQPQERSKSNYIRKFSRPISQMDQSIYLRYILDANNKIDPALNTHSDDFNSALNHDGGYGHVYFKTATMLNNLEYVLGEDLFKNAMQHYFQQWKICHPYFEDFRNSIINYSHVDLNWFFDQWLETTKSIDYKVFKPKLLSNQHSKYKYSLRFERKGTMQMPIDFRVLYKDSSYNDFVIPNSNFSKYSNSQTIPKWLGWGKLNPQYKFELATDKPIKNVIIDPSYKLADLNQLDNSSKFPCVFTFDHQLRNPVDRKNYILKWRPELWYNSIDGLKTGIHLQGNYMNLKHIFSFTAWYNTTLYNDDYLIKNNNYKSNNIVDYNFSYRSLIDRNSFLNIDSRILDGLVLNKIGLEKKIGQSTFRINFKSFKRTENIYIPGYSSVSIPAGNFGTVSFIPNLWNNNSWNNTINLDYEREYNNRLGNGIITAGTRASAIFSDATFASLNLKILNTKNIWKINFRQRLFMQFMSGENIAPESQLYLAGASPEENIENKFSRSVGIIPWHYSAYGTTTNHFQSGGGLNIRGYNGYLVPINKDGNQYYLYRGTSGVSANIEAGLGRLIKLSNRIFQIEPYLFFDAGIIQSDKKILNDRAISASVINPNETITSKIMASSGTGIIFSIKRWYIFNDLKPLNIRIDAPVYLSNAPYEESNNLKFRWLIGINTAL